MMPTRLIQRRKSIGYHDGRRTLIDVTKQRSLRFHIAQIFYPELQVGEWAAIPRVCGRGLLVTIQARGIHLGVLLLTRLIKGTE